MSNNPALLRVGNVLTGKIDHARLLAALKAGKTAKPVKPAEDQE